MVDLQYVHLSSCRITEFNNLLSLMQLQNSHISQVYKTIYALFTDINVAQNIEFQEFSMHFNMFTRYQANSEGYSMALDNMQVYHYTLVDKLMDSQVLAAAEQLELAVGHLELAARETKIRTNPQILLLNQGIYILEETELKIIEALEAVLANSRPPDLQN